MMQQADDLMKRAVAERVFPGGVLLVSKADTVLFFRAYGRASIFRDRTMTKETVFDLASLTKPLGTSLAVARLVDQGRIGLDEPVGTWLPALAGSDKASLTVRQLLCHQSGFPAHRLFYMTLKALAPVERSVALFELLKHTPLVGEPGRTTRYSDLGFMLLCRLIEAVCGCPMNRFLEAEIYAPMGLKDLFFVNLADSRRPHRPYAATEFCPVRNRLLVGEVHDDNAWFSGGSMATPAFSARPKRFFSSFDPWLHVLRGEAQQPFSQIKCLANSLAGRRLTPCRWVSTVRRRNIPARGATFQPIQWGILDLPVSLSGWILKKMSA